MWLRGCDCDCDVADDDDAAEAAAALRDFGTDDPRNGTEDGPVSCDELPLEELAIVAILV